MVCFKRIRTKTKEEKQKQSVYFALLKSHKMGE